MSFNRSLPSLCLCCSKSFLIVIIFLSTIFLTSCKSDNKGERGDEFYTSNGFACKPAPSMVYMWISSSRVNGDIGGVEGADAICETDSYTIGNLPDGLNHKAIIATSSYDPRDIFNNDPSVTRIDETPISPNYSFFFNLQMSVLNSVELASGSLTFVWTGIDANGAPSSNNCNDWSSSSISLVGTNASASNTNERRFHYPYPNPCNLEYYLICISYPY